MAITEDSAQSSPASLGRQVSFTASSDDANIVRMKGSVDIDSSAVIQLDPDIGDTNTFTFDFQKIVERNLGGYMTTEEGGHGMPLLDVWTLLDADEAFFDIQPTFTELVSTASGGLVDGANLVGTTVSVLNAFIPREQSQTFSNFNLSSSTSRFLTNNSPNSSFPVTKRKIRLTDNSWLSAYTTNSASTILLEVAVTNKSNVTTISFIDLVSLQTADRGDIPVGPINLNAASLAIGSAGSQPIIDGNTKSYTVTVTNRGSEEVTNGDFTSSVGWTQGGGWVIGGGEADNVTPNTGDTLSRTLSLSTSQEYYTSLDFVLNSFPATISVEHDDVEILNIEPDVDGLGVHFNQFTTGSSISNPDVEIICILNTSVTTIDDMSIKSRTRISETITFELEDICFDDEIHFYWENRYGGLDDYVFQSEQRGIAVDKKTYIKPLTKDFTSESRGRTTIGGESNSTFTAFSRPLKDNDLIWLEEILEDRMTYILVGTDFIPVTITKSSAQTVQDKLIQFSITYSYANNRIILGK